MNLWLLLPVEGHPAWEPWYDRCFGQVVRAEGADQARHWARIHCGDEGGEVWVDPAATTCEQLEHQGQPGLILQDVHSA